MRFMAGQIPQLLRAACKVPVSLRSSRNSACKVFPTSSSLEPTTVFFAQVSAQPVPRFVSPKTFLPHSSLRIPTFRQLSLTKSARPSPSGGILPLYRNHIQRRLMSLGRGEDPYKVLGVQQGMTDRDYKVAYLKLAKQYHPDLNPGNAEATRKFQQLAAAYDAIKNETSRQAWARQQTQGSRTDGDPRGAWSGFGRTEPAGQANPEDVWDAAAKDAAAMAEAFGDFLQQQAAEIEKDVNAFSTAAYEGNWTTARELAMKRKGLIIGVAVPLLVVLRWPAAAVAALRVASLGAGTALKFVGVFLVGLVRANPRLLPAIWQLVGPLAMSVWESAVRRAHRRLRNKQGK